MGGLFDWRFEIGDLRLDSHRKLLVQSKLSNLEPPMPDFPFSNFFPGAFAYG